MSATTEEDRHRRERHFLQTGMLLMCQICVFLPPSGKEIFNRALLGITFYCFANSIVLIKYNPVTFTADSTSQWAADKYAIN